MSRNERIAQLKTEAERLQQYSRKANAENHAVEKTATDDLTCIVQSIASQLEPSFSTVEDIIEAVHRKKGKPICVPRIIVRLRN